MIRRPITIERHRQIGAALKEMQEFIQNLKVDEVQYAYGKSSIQVKSLSQLEGHLRMCRCRMEDGLYSRYEDADRGIYFPSSVSP